MKNVFASLLCSALFVSTAYGVAMPHEIMVAMRNGPHQLYRKRMYEIMDMKPGQKILDFACGQGVEAAEIAEFVGETGQSVCVEPFLHEWAVGSAREKGVKVDVHPIFLEKGVRLPFADNYFDTILINRVLNVIVDYHYIVEELTRVLKPGGLFIATLDDISSVSMTCLNHYEESIFKSLLAQHSLRGYQVNKDGLQVLKKYGYDKTNVEWVPAVFKELPGEDAVRGAVDQLHAGKMVEDVLNRCYKQSSEGTFSAHISEQILYGYKKFPESNLNSEL